MSPRTRRDSASVLAPQAAPASAVVEEVLRRTAQVHKELEKLRWLSEHVARLPDVMALWFTDALFVDSRGSPLPLQLRGRRSLSALIRRVFPHGNIGEIVRSLTLARAVKKRGRYFYALSQYVSFSEDASFAEVHSLDSVHRLLGTVEYNVHQRAAERRLFERSAVVHSIPLHKLPDIHKRIREETGALLHRIDNFMREHQVPPGSERTAIVTLGAYEAIEPIESPNSTAGVRRRRRVRHRPGSRP